MRRLSSRTISRENAQVSGCTRGILKHFFLLTRYRYAFAHTSRKKERPVRQTQSLCSRVHFKNVPAVVCACAWKEKKVFHDTIQQCCSGQSKKRHFAFETISHRQRCQLYLFKLASSIAHTMRRTAYLHLNDILQDCLHTKEYGNLRLQNITLIRKHLLEGQVSLMRILAYSKQRNLKALAIFCLCQVVIELASLERYNRNRLQSKTLV